MIRRVLMTTDTVGGVWTYALELAAALGTRGVAVTLAALGAPRPDQRRAAEALQGVELRAAPFRLEWMERPWEEVRAAGAWLLGLEDELVPDVVHLNQYSFGLLPFRAPRLVVGHSCVSSWWWAVHGELPPRSWDRYRLEVARGLHAAGAVVAPTRAMARALEELYGLTDGSILTIPNARRPEGFRPAYRKEPLVLSAGRLWDEAKNLRALDAAAGGVPWEVVVAGPTEPPEGAGPRARPARVRLLGTLEPRELADWYGRASLYALPARYEPFGLSVLEAALSGCALVLGDVESLRETWDGAARFVDPDDPEELAATLRELAADAAGRLELAATALGRALELTPERQARRYLKLYARLTGAEPPGAERAIPFHVPHRPAPVARFPAC